MKSQRVFILQLVLELLKNRLQLSRLNEFKDYYIAYFSILGYKGKD